MRIKSMMKGMLAVVVAMSMAASDYLGAIVDEDYVKALPSNSYEDRGGAFWTDRKQDTRLPIHRLMQKRLRLKMEGYSDG